LLVYLLAKWCAISFATLVVIVALPRPSPHRTGACRKRADRHRARAAKVSDVSAFRNAYSRRIRDEQGQADCRRNLQEARSNLTRMFGDYRLADFAFSFAGGAERGR